MPLIQTDLRWASTSTYSSCFPPIRLVLELDPNSAVAKEYHALLKDRFEGMLQDTTGCCMPMASLGRGVGQSCFPCTPIQELGVFHIR